MRFSLAIPVLAANIVAALPAPAPAPQDIDLDMVIAAPDPTYTEAVGVTAQVVTYNPTSIAAQATSALSSVSIDVSDVLSSTAVAKRDMQKRTACAPQPTGVSSLASAPTDPAAWATYSSFSAAASSAGTPSGYTKQFTNLAASNNAYGYLGFSTLSAYDVNVCSAKCDAINGCMSFNLYFERDPSVDPGTGTTGCENPTAVTMIKCVFWGGPVNSANANNAGQWRNQFQVLIAGSNGYTNNSIIVPPGYNTPAFLDNKAINAPYDAQGYNTFAGSRIFTKGSFNATLCANYCDEQTNYNVANPAKDGTPPQVCNFFNTYLLYKVSGSSRIVQGQYCALYTEAWGSSYATNTGQYSGADQYLVEFSYTYTKSAPVGVIDPTKGDAKGAVYQAALDMKYYTSSLTATFQPFCSSVLSYSQAVATVTASTTVTPLSTSTVVVTSTVSSIAKRALATPDVLTKYPATVVASACSLIVTKPTGTLTTTASTTTATAVTSVTLTTTTSTVTATPTATHGLKISKPGYDFDGSYLALEAGSTDSRWTYHGTTNPQAFTLTNGNLISPNGLSLLVSGHDDLTNMQFGSGNPASCTKDSQGVLDCGNSFYVCGGADVYFSSFESPSDCEPFDLLIV